MLKKLLFVLAFAMLTLSCYQPERNCETYRTGEFIFNYEVNDSIKTGRFIRGDVYSVDYYDNKVDSASIRWFNDCEFVLQDLNSKVGIHYKIISTTDSSYTFQYKNAVKDPNRKLTVKTGTAYKTN